MRLLLFIVVCILFSPLPILGLIAYTYQLRRHSIPQKISGTANEPFATRVMMHAAGTRKDAATYALCGNLTVFNKFVHYTLIEVVRLASLVSGYKGSFLSYPGPRPSSLA